MSRYRSSWCIKSLQVIDSDGLDTWNSRDIVVRNWIVTNGECSDLLMMKPRPANQFKGDDCVAAKGNTTNLLVQNVTCHGGAGMTIGSVGQYPLTPDYVENVTFEVCAVSFSHSSFIDTGRTSTSSTALKGLISRPGKQRLKIPQETVTRGVVVRAMSRTSRSAISTSQTLPYLSRSRNASTSAIQQHAIHPTWLYQTLPGRTSQAHRLTMLELRSFARRIIPVLTSISPTSTSRQ